MKKFQGGDKFSQEFLDFKKTLNENKSYWNDRRKNDKNFQNLDLFNDFTAHLEELVSRFTPKKSILIKAGAKIQPSNKKQINSIDSYSKDSNTYKETK